MPKAKSRQKLNVYSTPIGFHDAFVAAPSQKAALEAWGASTNLFSQGSAHVVTDPKLTKVPLQNPGQVIKVSRGSNAEQLAALVKREPPKRMAEHEIEIVPKKAKIRAPQPNRSALTRAEAALGKLREKQESELARLDKEIAALEKRRREMQRRHEQQGDKAEERVEDERSRYSAAVDRYESG
jgi:flagellar motility protein MotE (MotC chaperone)